MAKKHRVKRQKYVEHLLRLEKDREAYLAKRMRPKRSREERHEGNIFAEAEDGLMGGDKKRERREEVVIKEEEEENKNNGVEVHKDGDNGVTESSEKVKVEEKKIIQPTTSTNAKRIKRKY